MGREFRKRGQSKPAQGSRALGLILGSFICGFLSSSIFNLGDVSNWMKKQVLPESQPAQSSIKPQQAQVPKPKFEFYTLLGNEQPRTNGSNANSAPGANTVVHSTETASDETVKAMIAVKSKMPPVSTASPTLVASTKAEKPQKIDKPTPQTLAAREAYLVQVAAFKARSDAEKMKASLLLKGFNVNIATVTQNRSNWYRVIIGPFSTRALAEKAQVIVSQSEHTKGMIRRMDA